MNSTASNQPSLHAATEVLDALLQVTRSVLGDNLVGVYLRGSLATGDFSGTSDLDVLTVIRLLSDGTPHNRRVALQGLWLCAS